MGRPQPLPPPPTHPVTDHLIALGKQTRQSLRLPSQGDRGSCTLDHCRIASFRTPARADVPGERFDRRAGQWGHIVG